MNSKKGDGVFFIAKGDLYYSAHVRPGSLCYIAKYSHKAEYSGTKEPTHLTVYGMGSRKEENVRISDIMRLTQKEAELLYALDEDTDRLKWFQEKTALKSATGLTVDTPVTVDGHGQDLRGVIRYIGPVTDSKYHDPISGTFFGIHLQGKDKGKGQCDGKFKSKSFFRCEKHDGLFVPFSRIRPVVPTSPTLSEPQASSQAQSNHIAPGEVVSYVDDQSHGLGIVIGMGEKEGEPLVCIETDNGQLTLPLHCVAKVAPEREVPMEVLDGGAASVKPQTGPAACLFVDSLVEVKLGEGLTFGVIRWIGQLPDRADTMCGLELDDARGVSDGQFKGTRFFSCAPQKALFVKLASVQPDSRFSNQSSANHGEEFANQEVAEEEAAGNDGYCDPVTVDPIGTDQVDEILIGRMKGIQGHCNSCYMDAALFSLFSCSSVLDSLLFKKMKPEDVAIQNTLLRNIVNPLRRLGFVEGKHIMKLRQQLLTHGYSHTFTTDEKDPEEFLTIIMQHIMALEPLLKLSTGGKVQDSYCYQIFLDQNHCLVLPTVQQLLEHSFHGAELKLAESPSCLILQMPRFGKKFKMFDKIIPSLELDVTDLLSEGPQQCMLCGQLALVECSECFKDPVFSQTGFKVFCQTCSSRVHSHPQRKAHHLNMLQLPKGFSEAGASLIVREKLELFAVLCIETSHYVSFVKHGPESQDWIFFDSMADREGGLNGYNIPQVQACPEVGEYLDMPPAELANQVPRDMKGVAKRLFCDAYMYLYKNTSQALYR